MRSTKSLILLVIAAGCGLIAALGFAQAMSSKGEKIETETIFVAADQVPVHTKLTAEHVKQEEWPLDKVPQGAARSLEEFEGLSPKYPLVPNEPIVMSRLSTGGDIASIKIPPGHQVMSVKVDKESALNGLITPGDKVDVLVFIRSRGQSDDIKTGTQTILRNITVFAVNDQMARDPEAEGTSIDAKTVSLLVLPKQSEKLLLARQLGTIHLTLRMPDDSSNMATDGAQPRDLFGESSQGSDGTNQTTEPEDNNGIIGLLTDMQAGTSTDVDSSSASVASDGPSMVIMSPDGVLGKFTFDAVGELPKEVREGGTGSPDPEPTPSNSSEEESSEEPAASEEPSGDDDEKTGDDVDLGEVLDPSILGF